MKPIQFSFWRVLGTGLLVAGLLSFFYACDLMDYSVSEDLLPSPPETFYSEAFGFQVEVQEEWLIVSVNSTNLAKTPGQSGDPDSLEEVPFEDGGSGIQFIELWTRPETTDKEHAALYVYAEHYDLSEEDYLTRMKATYAGVFGEVTSVLVEEDTRLLQEFEFHHFLFDSSLSNSEDHYYEEYFIRKHEDGRFLIVCTTYWADNKISYRDAMELLSCISFE